MMNKRALLWGGMVFAVVTATSCYLYGVGKTPREVAQRRINGIVSTAGKAATHDQAVHALPNSAEFDELTNRAPGFTHKLVTAITKVFGRTGFSYAGLTAPNKAKVNDLTGCSNTAVSGAATAARTGGGGGGGKTDAEKVENYITKKKATLTGYKNTITNRLTAMKAALADIDTTLAGKDLAKKTVTDFRDTERKQLANDIAANEERYNHLKHDYDWLIDPIHGYQLEATDAQAGAAIKTKPQAEAFIKEVHDLANDLQTNFTDANLTASKDAATALPAPTFVPAHLGTEADMVPAKDTIWSQYNRAVAEKAKLDNLIEDIERDAVKAAHASIATQLDNAKNNINGLKKFDTECKTKAALTAKIANIVTARENGAALRDVLKLIAENLETDYANLEDASSRYAAPGGGGAKTPQEVLNDIKITDDKGNELTGLFKTAIDLTKIPTLKLTDIFNKAKCKQFVDANLAASGKAKVEYRRELGLKIKNTVSADTTLSKALKDKIIEHLTVNPAIPY